MTDPNVNTSTKVEKKSKPYKYCFMRTCFNSTSKTPQKIFFTVPKGEASLRWYDAAGIDKNCSLTTHKYCCEDHFNMEEDFVNYLWYKHLNGAIRLIPRPNLIPRNKIAQDNIMNNIALPSTSDPALTEICLPPPQTPVIQVIQEIQDASPLSVANQNIEASPPLSVGNSSSSLGDLSSLQHESSTLTVPAVSKDLKQQRLSICKLESHFYYPKSSSKDNMCEKKEIKPKKTFHRSRESYCNPKVMGLIKSQKTSPNLKPEKTYKVLYSKPSLMNNTLNVSESNEVASSDQNEGCDQEVSDTKNCNVNDSDLGSIVQELLDLIPEGDEVISDSENEVSKVNSPQKTDKMYSLLLDCQLPKTSKQNLLEPKDLPNFRENSRKKLKRTFKQIENDSSPASVSSDLYSPTSNTSDDILTTDSETRDLCEHAFKINSLHRVRLLCEKYPMFFLGVPKECLFIVDMLACKLKFDGRFLEAKDVVILILRKVRRNEAHFFLALEFGISRSHVSQLLDKYLSTVSFFLKTLIRFHGKEQIYRNLPLQFQARYYLISRLIDCFETSSEKPSNPVQQSMSWSDYKSDNTIKHLVSSSPDGTVDSVSKGYTGRQSDLNVVTHDKYVERLEKGEQIMADRGFKNVDDMLRRAGCRLVRPPSVKQGEILEKSISKEAKRIAGLRSHIERLIRRLREFHSIQHHVNLDINEVKKVDHFVLIAAGLSTLHKPLINL